MKILLLILLLFGETWGIIAPPLPPLPIEETQEETKDHMFNIDGSPREELQLKLFKENDVKSNENVDSERTILEPPSSELPPVVHHHRGPPAIRPPLSTIFPIEAIEELTTIVPEEEKEEEETISTQPMNQASLIDPPSTSPMAPSTPNPSTTATFLTSTTPPPNSTEEPKILIPVPKELAAATSLEPRLIAPEDLTTTATITTGEPKILISVPEKEIEETTVVSLIQHNSGERHRITTSTTTTTDEPRILIPVPGEENLILKPSKLPVVESIKQENREQLSKEELKTIISPPNDEEIQFTTTLEPLVTIPVPEETTTTIHRRRLKVVKVEMTTHRVNEIINSLVKSLPDVGVTDVTGNSTLLPPLKIQEMVTTETRRGDIEVIAPARTLHRGFPSTRRIRHRGRAHPRRLLKIPQTGRNRELFRSTPKASKIIRRLRKKVGVSHRIANQ